MTHDNHELLKINRANLRNGPNFPDEETMHVGDIYHQTSAPKSSWAKSLLGVAVGAAGVYFGLPFLQLLPSLLERKPEPAPVVQPTPDDFISELELELLD